MMSKQARLDTPETLHHVIIQRIEKRFNADDVKDKQVFYKCVNFQWEKKRLL